MRQWQRRVHGALGMGITWGAAWGAVGGLLLSAIFTKAATRGWGDVLAIAATFVVASAVFAAGSLAIARKR